MSTTPNDTTIPNNASAPTGDTPSKAVPAPNPGPKKSALLGASAIAEQAKKDAKKKVQCDKAALALAAKLSRKAAEKKCTKVTTTLQGLKETLRNPDNAPSDMEISDEELPRPAIGTANRYAPLQELNPQQAAHHEPMITDENSASAPPEASEEQPQENQLPPAPVTPTRPDTRMAPDEEGSTNGKEAADLDSFTAARVGLIAPNRVAYTAPTPDHVGDGIQELFPPIPPANTSQSHEGQSNSSTATPTSASDSKLLNRLQLAAAYAPTPPSARQTLNESEYTPGPFPTIHDPNPVHAIAAIDEKQILTWNQTLGGKLIARLFDSTHESRPPATIAAIIQQAVATITCSPKARVATPIGKYPGITPNSFFVFNINEDSAKAMTTVGVWSSTVITFQAMELNPALPTYLFPVWGFNNWTPDEKVEEIIKARWLAEDSILEFRRLIALFDDESGTTAPLTEEDIVNFLKSLTVSRLETKVGGGYPRPTHRLHADPTVLKAEPHLYALRAHLRTLEYHTHYDGSGIPEPDWDCPICNSIDHPKGMCPFPDVPGWNGPKRQVEKKEKAFSFRSKEPMHGSTRGGAPRGRGAKRPF